MTATPEIKKPRLRRSAKVRLIEFLRPGSYTPDPYSIEMAFQALRHLLASGVGYTTQHHWHTTSVTKLLGGYSPDCGYPKPVQNISDLLSRFHAAVLSRTSFAPEVEKWRKDKGIDAYAELDMKFLHYKPFDGAPHLGFNSERAVKEGLNSLFVDAVGKKTAVSLNCIHHKAQRIHKVDVTISPDGFEFTLRYGFHAPDKAPRHGDSEWNYTLARTQKATGSNHRRPEPFLDTLRRALDQYAFIMDPKNGHLMHNFEHQFVERKDDPYWGPLLEKAPVDDQAESA